MKTRSRRSPFFAPLKNKNTWGRGTRRRRLLGEQLEARWLLAAEPITIDPDGPGPQAEVVINSFDFLPGNVLQQGLINPATPGVITTGTVGEAFYQAALGSFLNAGGMTIAQDSMGNPITLGTDYEITTVISVTTVVIDGSGPGDPSGLFGIAGAQSANAFGLELWFDDTPDANNLAGTGFRDGQLILQADVLEVFGTLFITSPTPVPFDQSSDGNQYPATSTLVGIGGTSFEGDVDLASVDADFFITIPDLITANTNNKTPFSEINPSMLFFGDDGDADGGPAAQFTITPNIGTINNFSGPDAQFQADANASFSLPGSIHGQKFHDLDADGVKDAGEPGLNGWTINLDGVDNLGRMVHLSTVTGDNPMTPGVEVGAYWFDNLTQGTYTVSEVLQAGWIQSFPTPVPPGTHQVFVTSPDPVENIDFGNFQITPKSGQKFHDLDADGVKDAGEPGLAGWEIRAFRDDNNDGILQAGEAVLDPLDTTAPFDADAITDASGNYTLSLRPGVRYIVVETSQAGFTQTFPASVVTSVAGLGPRGYDITLVSGVADTGNDFGNFQITPKSGQKFHDLDADGVKDAGEPGLAGWEIRAFRDDNNDGILQAGEAVLDPLDTTAPFDADAITDASGNYTLSLRPGVRYIVVETSQAGFTQTFPASVVTSVAGLGPRGYDITLVSGVADTGNDFGNFQITPKSGQKFHDLDADGVKDAGEPGLAGWEIRAFRDDNNDGILQAGEAVLDPLDTTAPFDADAITDASGNYTLSLRPGVRYIVVETSQAGFTQTFPASVVTSVAGLGPRGYDITLVSGVADTGNDFGNFQITPKSGQKFHDLDADGVKDAGEPGLAGWEIRAFRDDNNDGILQAGEAVLDPLDTTAPFDADAITDASGNYTLSLRPGVRYIVVETSQAGFTQTFPASVVTSVAGLGPRGYDITLVSGVADTGNDFGNFQITPKSGQKFHDLDADGVKDAGEPGLAGWEIRAFRDDNNDGILQAGEAVLDPLDTTAPFDADAITDASGNYTLSLRPGVRYIVVETSQAGFTQTFPASVVTSVAGLGPRGYDITLVSGVADTGNDFGNFQITPKSGQKFHDLDADGVKDAGEPGLAGWEIRAFRDDNNDGILQAGEAVLDPLDTTAPFDADAITDASGNYTLSLRPGVRYIVVETSQAGFTQTFPASVVTSVAGLGPRGYDITLVSGVADTGNDFGNFQITPKSGQKFHDLDADGVKDAGEPGLAGWEIRAFRDDNNDGILQAGEAVLDPLDTTAPFDADAITDASGNYTLSLRPGVRYIVVETSQAGFTQTFPASVVTSVAGLGPRGYDITLVSGVADTGNDFGNTMPMFEGCTPGFWKGNAENALRKPDKFGFNGDPNRPLGWEGTGVQPTDPLSSVGFDGFTVASGDATTFLAALSQGGGGENALMRHAAAAYLNAAHPEITYAIGEPDGQGVVDAVNAVLAIVDPAERAQAIEELKNELDEFNNAGCGVDQFGRPIENMEAARTTKSGATGGSGAALASGSFVVDAGTSKSDGRTTKSSAVAARDAAFNSDLLLLTTQSRTITNDSGIEDLFQASDGEEDDAVGSLDEVFALLGAA